MVTLDARPQVENPDTTLNDRVSREVAQIVAAAAEKPRPSQPARPETRAWSYTIPFAGVRYYGYHR